MRVCLDHELLMFDFQDYIELEIILSQGGCGDVSVTCLLPSPQNYALSYLIDKQLTNTTGPTSNTYLQIYSSHGLNDVALPIEPHQCSCLSNRLTIYMFNFKDTEPLSSMHTHSVENESNIIENTKTMYNKPVDIKYTK